MREVISLFQLATNVFVRHANLLWSYIDMIPAVIYDSLLEASLRTDRILSTRCLFSTWPLQELSLVGCKEIFKKQHALILGQCLESGCSKLREVDLTGCNIGAHGTTCFLMLVVGRPLPNVDKYSKIEDKTSNSASDSKRLQTPLSITTNCYVNVQNYPLFLEVLNGHSTLHDFIVSKFYAIELGLQRIMKVLKKLGNFHAQSVIGFNFEMNSFPRTILENESLYIHSTWKHFSNLQRLDLSMNLIGAHAIYIILKHITASLTHLLLNSCGIRADNSLYFNQISELSCIQKTEHLELEHNHLRKLEPGLMKFLESCSGTLKSLNLKNNGLTDECVPKILEMLDAPFTLKLLSIGHNRFSPNTMEMLSENDVMLLG